MSALKQVMQVIGSHDISSRWLESDSDKSGGLISNGEYAWFASGENIILYSKRLGSIVSSRSFAGNQKDKSLKITFVKELHKNEEASNFILVGCSFKSTGILFVCQLPALTTVRCIYIPNPISYISTLINESLAEDQLCDEFKIMSTVLLVGMATGAAYAIDLRLSHIENQLRRNEIVVNELRPSKLFIIRKNEDCQEVKEMSDDSDSHLAMFINENFCNFCKKQYRGKLNFYVSSLLYNEEINTIAIGYSTGHFQLWDCKAMRTIYLTKEPKCDMPVTHITFLEPSDDPNNLCYLWVIQSDNSRLPNATMIALTYEHRIIMSNGCFSYRVFKGSGIKLEMSLRRETGIGRCISALTLCNVNLFRNETDMDEDCEIRLFAMLMETRQNVDSSPESYIFLFDINQWYKAQMPSNINHLKVSNSYASFVKLPHNVSYLDLNISDKTLRPFGYNLRNNVEELYYPSSIYFECDCLLDTEIIKFKHSGVQQEILDQLLLKNWRLLINPSLIFSQCLQTNLRPFFWDKTDDYSNYSLPDQRSFVISIIVENKIMSVLTACAEEWKNGTYASSEATILHLVQCLWKHVMVVKQYADKLCVPLFDYSGTQLGKKNERILNHCLSQMLCVKHFLEDLHNAYGIHIINVDYSYRVYTLNLVTQYFKAVTCFLNYGLLPESIEEDPTQKIIQCDFTSLIQYAIKRRTEFGDLPLYLIDAFVTKEPKGNKLIEQWQHEGGEATKGLYPPSNVQCLLRIYLNAALSNQVKDFITIYFLIDVCSLQEIDVITANRMCNFAVEFDVENKDLNTLCRASWLLDHDMFEEAMNILSNNNEWMVDDKSWEWYHWTVLKLLVFKEQYFWARFYMQFTKINLEHIDDHKFYVNLQIMNNQCFDTLIYIRGRPLQEKQTLFEYLFDRCRETNKLKCLIEYLWDTEEAELFFSYLKKFDDSETLTFQLLFLLQQGRHLEAIKLNQTLKAGVILNNNDALSITSLLVDGFEKTIPNVMKQNYKRHPLQNVYGKSNVVVKCMNTDSKMFIMDKNKTSIFVKSSNALLSSSNSINLFIPENNTRKRSPVNDIICNEKRRKVDDDLLNAPNADSEIVRPIEKQVLEILNTPLVEKTISSPSVTRYSSILKSKLATNNKSITSSIRFSLPSNADTTERIESKLLVEVKNTDNPENESFYSVSSNDTNDLPGQIILEEILLTSQESIEDDNKRESINTQLVTNNTNNDEYEKMDISVENASSEHFKEDDIDDNEIEEIVSNSDECIMLTDEESDKEMPVSKSLPQNTSSILKRDIELFSLNNTVLETIPKCDPKDTKQTLNSQFKTTHSLGVDNSCRIQDIQQISSSNENTSDSLTQDKNSNDNFQVKEKDNDDKDLILLYSDEDESDILSVDSSDVESSDCSIVSEDSDLENTRYGRFKSQMRRNGEDSNDEVFEDDLVEENEEEAEEEAEEEGEEYDEVCSEESEGELSLEQYENIRAKNDENDLELNGELRSEESKKEISLEQCENIQLREDENDSDLNSEVCEDESEIELSLEQCENIQLREDENDSEFNSELCEEINSENSYMDDLDQNNEDEGSDTNDDRSNENYDQNNLGLVNFINEDEINVVEDREYESDEIEECRSENSTDDSYDENEESFEEPPIAIGNDFNVSGLPLIELGDSSEENSLVVPDVILHNSSEQNNLDEPAIILDDVISKENNSEDPRVIIDDSSEQNCSEEMGVILVDSSKQNNSDEPAVKFDDVLKKEYNSEVPDVILDDSSEQNSSEEPDVILDNAREINNSEEPSVLLLNDESSANNFKSFNTLNNEKTSENNEIVDGDNIMYPIDSQSNSLENLTPCFYNQNIECYSKGNNQISDDENENSHSIIIKNSKTKDLHVKEDDDIIELVENTDINNKTSAPINLDFIKNNELCNNLNENQHLDDSIKILRDESNPTTDAGFNHLTMAGIESVQLETCEMDVNQSIPFMFGESFFGQQEIPESKPKLLFGHVYSFEEGHLNVDTQANKLETQELVDNNEEIIHNNSDVENVEDDIQDIFELESLPESNPDDNFDSQKNTDSNDLQPVLKEINETFYDKEQPVLLGDSCLPKPIYFGNIDSLQVFEIDDQTPGTSVDLSKNSLQLENKNFTSYEYCDSLNIKQKHELEKQIFKTDDVPNRDETLVTNSVDTIKSNTSSCINVDNEKNLSLLQSNITTTSKPKQLLNIVNIDDFEAPNSKCVTSVVSCSLDVEQCNNFNDGSQLLKNKNILKTINTSLNIEDIESHQLVETKNTMLQQDDTNILTSADKDYEVQKIYPPISSEPSKTLIKEFPNSMLNNEILAQEEMIELNVMNKSDTKSCKSNENQNRHLRLHSPNSSTNASITPIVVLQKSSPTMCDNLIKQRELPIEETAVELESSVVNPQCPDGPDSLGTVVKKNKTNVMEKCADLNSSYQKSTLDIPKVENYSLRSSSRKSVSKTNECLLLDVPSTAVQKLTRSKKRLSSGPIQEDKLSTSIVIEQIDKNKEIRRHRAKSNPLTDTETIRTRLRAKSESKQVLLDTMSSNIFRSSEMIEDNNRYVRVSLSKKRSKSQENISSTKRRSGRSKSLAPVNEPVANRRTVFGLEEIPEEDTSNTDKNNQKIEHAAVKRKSKFNFFSNISKQIEHDNKNTKPQQDTKIRTPRRSKSAQPEPVLTLSAVKTKPKRSSSVNRLILNDEMPTAKVDLSFLKKGLKSPIKLKKRSLTEPVKSRKKQKTLNQFEKVVDESENSSNESNQSYPNSNSSYSCEQISPIAGNVSRHMLYTPAKKRTKIRMTNLDSENEDSLSDVSTDSKRVVTRSMIQNSSFVEFESKISIGRQRRTSISNISEINTPKKSATLVTEKDELLPKRKAKNIKETIVQAPMEPSNEQPPISERRMTRFQQSILDRSLQSTSVIGQDMTTTSITVPKPEKKKNIKKTNLKKSNN